MKQKPEKKNITIYDIAKEAGVSPSMVSRVVSGNGNVAEKNRVKIQKYLDKYNYRPNAMARSLQKMRTKLIGFVLPHIGNEYFSSVYYEFEKHASAGGYMTILYNGKSDFGAESRILNVLAEARVEAVVFMGGRTDTVQLTEDRVKELRDLNHMMPCILCSSRAEEFGCMGVHSDDAVGAELLIQHLKEQGYQKMAILGGTDLSYPSYFKKMCLIKEAKKQGIENRPEWNIGNSFNEQDGEASMDLLLKQEELPDVVCCINDHVAFGALNRAIDEGIRIPEQMAFTGFDGVAASAMAKPGITTVAIDYEEYGRQLYEKMVNAMEQKECESVTLIKPRIIVRKSTKKKEL